MNSKRWYGKKFLGLKSSVGVYSIEILMIVSSILLFIAGGSYGAAIETVTGNGTAVGTPGTLAYAITNVTTGGTINFTTTGTVTLTLTADLPVITSKNITINGPSSGTFTIDGGNAYKIFDISSSTVSIDNLIIQGGKGYLSGADYFGGAIYATNSDIALANCDFQSNTGAYRGGAVYFTGSGKTLHITECAFQNNTALAASDGNNEGFGGGLELNTGTGTIERCTFYNNTADSVGGGIYVGLNGNLTITNSTVSGNTCNAVNGGYGEGGGISNDGPLTINFCTIVNNTAAVSGGGVSNYGSTVTATDTILVSNTAPSGANYGNTGGSYTPTRVISTTTNLNLQALTDNGGPTQTHALLVTSTAAVDQSTQTSGVPTTDQRGVTRTGNYDIGAYEYAGSNTAPTLDNTKTPVLSAVNEDAGAPSGVVGTLISSLVDIGGALSNVTDPDSSPSTGIAVTAADTTNGSWFFTINGGGVWNALGTPNVSSSRLLAADANTFIYFQPNANYNGTVTPAITFRAWDQTSGSNGGTADTSANGGTTAFSTATDTADITVTPIADTPTVGSPMINEDTDSGAIEIIRSANDGSETTHYKITSITNGTLYSDSGYTSQISNGDFIPSAGSTTNVYFRPVANYNGSGGFTVQASTSNNDSGLGGGTVNSTVTINPVNDAPTLSGGPYFLTSIDENTTSAGVLVSSIIGSVTYADVDGGASSGIAITARTGNGIWQYSTDNSIWTDFGTVSGSLSLLLDSGSYVRYVPDGENGETATFTFRAWDQTSGAASTNGSPSTADTSVNGGTSAFSTGTALGQIVVTSVSDVTTLYLDDDNLDGIVHRGEDVELTIRVSNNASIVGYRVALDLDPSKMTYVDGSATKEGTSTEIGWGPLVVNSASPELAIFACASATGALSDATSSLMKFQLHVNETLADFTPITVTFNPLTSLNEDAVAFGAEIWSATVLGPNHIPTFTGGPNQVVLEDSGYHQVDNWATDIYAGSSYESWQSLYFTLDIDKPQLFFGSPTLDETGTLRYTLATDEFGICNATAVLHDSGGTANGGIDSSTPFQFTINVNPVNDAPSFIAGATVVVLNATGGQQTVYNWATGIIAGPANESAQTLWFDVESDRPELFSATPTIDAGGTLRFTPNANAHGVVKATATLRDDGGIANGGIDKSSPAVFVMKIYIPFLWGDLNDNAQAGSVDASLLLQFAAELIDVFPGYPVAEYPEYYPDPTKPWLYFPLAADVNADGVAGTWDASLLLQKYAFLINWFPADINHDQWGPDAPLPPGKAWKRSAPRNLNVSLQESDSAVTVTFQIDNAEDVQGLRTVLFYNPAQLQFDEEESGWLVPSGLMVANDVEPGRLVLAGALGTPLKGESWNLLRVKFDVVEKSDEPLVIEIDEDQTSVNDWNIYARIRYID